MIRSSSFNVFLPPRGKYSVSIYNTAMRKSYQFVSPWSEILQAAKWDDEVANRLLSFGLLTQAQSYQEELGEFYLRKTSFGKDSLVICYTITTECSLGCDYCFQKNVNREPTTSKIITRFCSLLQDYLHKNESIQKVQLVLFGGDPILQSELCVELTSKIREICLKFSITFTSLMTTNGIIADAAKLKALSDAGLAEVMISFDGSKEEHDRNRNGTFDTLIENLPILSQHFSLILKYNITKNNSSIDEFTNFIHHMQRAVPSKDFLIALEAIHPVINLDISREISFDIKSTGLARKMLKLYDVTRNLGLRCDIGNALHPPCPYTQENSIIVQPDGTFSCCSAGFDIPEFEIGNIQDVHELPIGRHDLRNYVINAAERICAGISCSLFPICETGCPYEKHRLRLSKNDVLCRRTYIEEFIPFLFQLGLDE